MRKLITRLQSVQNWSFNLRQTAPQPDPLGPPFKRATTPGMEIARDDKTWIYISDAIFEYSKRHEPSLKAFDMIRMTDRILTWTTSFTGNYADAKSDIEKMLGIEKRPSNYRQFPFLCQIEIIELCLLQNQLLHANRSRYGWDRWGKRGHYEVNWLPFVQDMQQQQIQRISRTRRVGVSRRILHGCHIRWANVCCLD
jgi:hypothetical protein